MAKIKYGEKTIAEITAGQSLTLHVAEQEMEHDIEIEGFASAEGGGGTGGDMICTLVDPNSIGDSAFIDCLSLKSVNAPSVTDVKRRAFNNCTSLTSIDLPNATSISAYAFRGCTSLASVELPLVDYISVRAFYGCTSLDTFILSNTKTVCDLDITAIMDTKIATAEGMPTGEGFVYVPTKFYEAYVANFTEQATALLVSTGVPEAEAVVMAEQISRAVLRKIEDYPEICG